MVVARTTRTRISEEYRIAIGRILRVLHETVDVQGARGTVIGLTIDTVARLYREVTGQTLERVS